MGVDGIIIPDLPFKDYMESYKAVAERYGIALTFLEGERFNLKITTPEDLILAKAILQSRPV